MRDSHLKEVDMQLEKVYLDNIDGLLNEEDNELVKGLELKNLKFYWKRRMRGDSKVMVFG